MLTDTPNAKAVRTSNDGRTRLGQLINSGIINEPDNELDPLTFTDDVRESLLLDVR